MLLTNSHDYNARRLQDHASHDHSMFNWIHPFLFLSNSVHTCINLLQVCVYIVLFSLTGTAAKPWCCRSHLHNWKHTSQIRRRQRNCVETESELLARNHHFIERGIDQELVFSYFVFLFFFDFVLELHKGRMKLTILRPVFTGIGIIINYICLLSCSMLMFNFSGS